MKREFKGLGASWDAASPVTVIDDQHSDSCKRNQTKGSDFLMISGDGNLASDWLITLWKTSLMSLYIILPHFVYLLTDT